MSDETFNYSVIKLIVSITKFGAGYKLPIQGLQVALNEQFMVAGLGEEGSQTCPVKKNAEEVPEPKNRIIRVMMRRLGSCRTLGENMIFMLNRASKCNLDFSYDHISFLSLERSNDDHSVKLLILKMLYLIFSTNGTSEYFYTNDLCVLMDVFLRELVDLDEESESVCSSRHIVILDIFLTPCTATAYVSPRASSFVDEDSTPGYTLQTTTDLSYTRIVTRQFKNTRG